MNDIVWCVNDKWQKRRWLRQCAINFWGTNVLEYETRKKSQFNVEYSALFWPWQYLFYFIDLLLFIGVLRRIGYKFVFYLLSYFINVRKWIVLTISYKVQSTCYLKNCKSNNHEKFLPANYLTVRKRWILGISRTNNNTTIFWLFTAFTISDLARCIILGGISSPKRFDKSVQVSCTNLYWIIFPFEFSFRIL